MSFLRRKKPTKPPPPPTPVQEEVMAQEYLLRIALVARSSDGLRLPADPRVAAALPGIVEPLSQTTVETIQPLPLEYSDASPAIERYNEVQQWVLARRDVTPIGRHGLYVLEMTDALDMTVDTFSCGLLHGETTPAATPSTTPSSVGWPRIGTSCPASSSCARWWVGAGRASAVTPSASARRC